MKKTRIGTRIAAGTVSALAVVSLIAGCAGNSAPSGISAKGNDTISAKLPNSINVSFVAQVQSLDPLLGFGVPDINAIGLFGEGLYEFRYGKGSKPQPGLAESDTVSTDQLTWTFKLRPGLVFSDGTALTSRDVKATLDRTRTDTANVWAPFAQPMSSVDAPDASTVVVHLSRPYPTFKTILAESGFAVFPASAYDKGPSYWSAPVSAGPYKVLPWDGGINLSMVVNDKYWGSKPVIPKVNFTAITDFNTASAQLQTGQIDMAQGLPMSVQPTLAAAKGVGWNLVQTYGLTALSMNNKVAPFDDVNVRKAVSLALNRDQINKIAWLGLAKPVAQFWPSTMEGFDAGISTKQDLTKAKALLKGTACENGCNVELDYSLNDGAWSAQAAQIAAANLAQVGIHAKLTSMGTADWNNQVVNEQHDQIANVFIYDFANIPDGMLEYTATPSAFFHAFYSNWADPELDGVVQRALVATGSDRAKALKAVNDLYQKDMPFAAIATSNDLWAQRVSTKYVNVEQTDQIEIARVNG